LETGSYITWENEKMDTQERTSNRKLFLMEIFVSYVQNYKEFGDIDKNSNFRCQSKIIKNITFVNTIQDSCLIYL